MQYKRTQKEIEYCKYLSEVIKELRIKKGKSLNRLALDSLMTPSTLCRIENNLNTAQITNLAKIAAGLDFPLSKIIAKLEKKLPKDFFIDD